MIRTLDSSQCLTTLSGGRAPGCWRQDLSRETWRLTGIRRGSRWIEDLLDFDLRLSDQPLLGRTLAALMAQGVAPQALQAEPTPSRAKFSEPAPFRQRELKTAAEAGTQRSSAAAEGVKDPMRGSAARSNLPGSTQHVMELSPQVDTPLLRRLAAASELLLKEDSARRTDGLVEGANDRDAIANPAQLSSARKRLKDHLVQDSTPRRKTQLPSASVEPQASVAPVSQFENITLAQRAAQRVEMALRRDLSATRNLSQTSTPKDTSDRSTWLSLADSWSIPLNGPNASTKLLVRFANLAERGSRRDSEREITQRTSLGTGTAQPSAKPPSDSRLNRSVPSTAHRPIDHAHSQLLQQSSWSRPTNESWPAPEDEVFEPSASSVLAEPLRSTANDAEQAFLQAAADQQTAPSQLQTTTPSIAPPSLTPSLLPLHPPRTSGEEVLPVAVITAQRDARSDEVTARGEDLNLLASRIERILNDEARRHGIDV